MSNRFQFASALARVAIGLAGTASMTGASVFIFLPFSDLSTLQLAAGPFATRAPASAPAAIVLANTGRVWGAEARLRYAAAASAPLAHVAQRGRPTSLP